jgi:hypothetical protein
MTQRHDTTQGTGRSRDGSIVRQTSGHGRSLSGRIGTIPHGMMLTTPHGVIRIGRCPSDMRTAGTSKQKIIGAVVESRGVTERTPHRATLLSR